MKFRCNRRWNVSPRPHTYTEGRTEHFVGNLLPKFYLNTVRDDNVPLGLTGLAGFAACRPSRLSETDEYRWDRFHFPDFKGGRGEGGGKHVRTRTPTVARAARPLHISSSGHSGHHKRCGVPLRS